MVDGCYIELGRGFRAIVSPEDFVRCAAFKWSLTNCAVGGTPKYYARRNVRREDGTRRTQYLHRFIMGEPAGVVIDHKDDDGLNCRRWNLEEMSQSQNIIRRKGRQYRK